MAITDIIVPNNLVVVSDSTTELAVRVIGDEQEKGAKISKPMGVICSSTAGEIVNRVFFKAPVVDFPEDITITATSRANPAISKSFTVSIILKTKISKPSKVIVPSTPLEIASGGEIALPVSGEDIIFITTMGRVDERGVFYAPSVDRDTAKTIIVFSKKSSDKYEVTVIVKAIQILITNSPSIIYAGGKAVDFEVSSNYDLTGPYNFHCYLISGEGEVTEKGVYTPPNYLTKGDEVVIEVQSLSNRNIKRRISFMLRPPLCEGCGMEVNPKTGYCPTGHKTKFSVEPLKCNGCGKPLSVGVVCSCLHQMAPRLRRIL